MRIIPVIDADELYHSKGPWLTHKYIRREGEAPPYRYFYGEKTSTGKQVGEEKEVFLTETKKNEVTGGITNHYHDTNSLDIRQGQYFEDAEGKRVAKIHPLNKNPIEFYDHHLKSISDMSMVETVKNFRELGMGFLSNQLKKLEPTYGYTNRAKGVLETGAPSEYASTPRRKRKPR